MLMVDDWKGLAVSQEDLDLINQVAKSPLGAEQVYAFSVRLCDNEVDRDFERFDNEALERLGELLVGKSGIFDHQWSARGQTARIYRTEVVREPAVVTEAVDNIQGAGRVSVMGNSWAARSERAGETIPTGETVTVVRIEGVKLIVARP